MMLGNHLSSVALAPALGLFALTRPKLWLSPLRLGRLVAATLASAAFFNTFLFYLLWRRHLPFDQYHAVVLFSPELYHTDDSSFWHAWWFTVSGGQFKSAMTVDHAWRDLQVRLIPHRVIGQFGPIGAGAILLGWLLLWRRAWRINLLLTVLSETQSALNMHYQVWKVKLYYVTPYACCALWLAVALGGLGLCLQWLIRRLNPKNPFPGLTATALTLAILGGLFFANQKATHRYKNWVSRQNQRDFENIVESLGPRPDHHTDDGAHERSRKFIETIPNDSVVLSCWWFMYPIAYVAVVEHRWPDFAIHESYPFPFGLGQSQIDLIDRTLHKHPLYLVDDPKALQERGYKLKEIQRGFWQFE
jgi:hypothetical protein